MDAMYAIVKVYITVRHDAIKRHSNVITISRTSAIEVTALLKKYVQKWKVCKKKNLSWAQGVENPVPRDHCLASLGKLRDARQWSSGRIFLSTPHTTDRFF